ncbi:MAG: DNA gyrase inhibitor YacG [Legionella sp.]|uniref:DNA gyrase inhibitor YacG n=1 Tax=Legionella sp. TaxID=459 RepID=UPI0039E6261C
MNNAKEICCPICNKQNTWNPENSFRPFCSRRCKLIDLGEWANESRKIHGNPVSTEIINLLHDNTEN